MKNLNVWKVLMLVAGLLSCTFQASAQISLVPFVSNVTAVTDIRNCGDDRLFIVEQAGRIRISDLQGNLTAAPFLSIVSRVASGGERGLLGLAFSPNYATDGRFYVNYTNTSGNTTISRFHVNASNPDLADSLDEEILFTVNQPYSNHNGGSLFFGNDGYLYIGLGDGGSGGDPGNRAQNLAEHLGKLHRINVNVPSGYSIPGSNPFYGSPTANQKIWAYGLRNPWRISKDRLTGDVWIADVGQNTWEEIDFQPANDPGGHNYGWRCYEGNVAYNTTGCQPMSNYDFPIYVYNHSTGCSVTGGYVYRGAQYSDLFGKYFFTDYCDGILRSLEPDNMGGYTFASYGAFQTNVFSTLGEDVYGELYVGKNSTGVLKMTNNSCSPVAYIGSQNAISQCGSSYTFSTPAGVGFLYQWYLNGVAIPGASDNTYTATQDGTYNVQVVNTSFCFTYSDTVQLTLVPAPVVSLSGLPSLLCSNAGPVTMTGNPTGGVFSGAGVVNDVFTASAAGVGTHVITYTYDNGNGCVIPVTSTVVVDACLSVAGHEGNYGFQVNPNPAGEFTRISWSPELKGMMILDVMDAAGKKVLTEAISENTNFLELKTGVLSAGMYILRLQNGTGSWFRKLSVN